MKIRETTVAGLRVAHIPSKSGISCISISVGVGGAYESDKNLGISHFLEHCNFLGSEKFSKKAYWKEAQKIGADLNAHTSGDWTKYRIECLSHEPIFDRSLEILADIFMNSKFREDEFEKERTVVLDEIRRSNDNAWHYFYRQFRQKFCDRPILGDSEVIEKLSIEDLKQWKNRFYRSDNIVVTVVSSLPFDLITKSIERHLGALVGCLGQDFSYTRNQRNDVFPGEYTITKPGIDQTYYGVAYKGIRPSDPDFLSAWVLTDLFGCGMASRLGQRIREELGLVYGIHMYTTSGVFSSEIQIMTSSEDKKIAEIDHEIKELTNKILSNDPATSEEVKRVKTSVLTGWKQDQDKAVDIDTIFSPFYITEQITGQRGTYINFEKLLSEVSEESVNRVAKRIFSQDKFVGIMKPA